MNKNTGSNNDNPWDMSDNEMSNKSNIVDFTSKFKKTKK